MITSFKQYYDKITNLAAPGYKPAEILLFLNNAQDEFIRNLVFGTDNQPLASDHIQRRAADLRPIIGRSLQVPTGPISGLYNEWQVALEDITDFQYLLSAQVKLTRTNYPIVASAEFMPAKIVDSMEWQSFQGGVVSNRMILHKIPLLVEEPNLKLTVDEYTTPTQVNVNYTKIPTPIENSAIIPDLSVHTHQLIVDIAVRQALATSQDKRWQSQVAEQQIKSA